MTRTLLIIITYLSACTQNKNNNPVLHNESTQISTEYFQKAIEFIKQVQKNHLRDSTFILADRPFTFKYPDCLQELLTDTSTYTKEELLSIRNKKYPSISHWTKESFPNIKLASSDSISAIFEKYSDGWTIFYKNFGRSFNTFSAPIFLRNYTYCLFYTDNHCGSLCAKGNLELYEKVNEKWTLVKSYCNWVS